MGFYGNALLLHECCDKQNNFEDVFSVAFNEYYNYSKLLESCTDDQERTVLETKVEVLYEVSFKDIKQSIKKFFEKIFEMIKKY